jgi:hypothetical protein
VPADTGGVVPHYEVTVIINSGDSTTFLVQESEFTVIAEVGNQVSISVQAINPNDPSRQGPTSAQSQAIKLLSPDGDKDSDGMSNADEAIAGTNPLDNSSRFKVDSTTVASDGEVTITWTPSPSRSYALQASTTLATGSWTSLATGLTSGSYTDTTADEEPQKFFRIIVE